MSDRDQLYLLDQRAWLLAIGRRLRVEYDAIAEPLPPRLAALVKQLETPAQGIGQETSRPAMATDHPVRPRSDWDETGRPDHGPDSIEPYRSAAAS
jgi:hypothetical protein